MNKKLIIIAIIITILCLNKQEQVRIPKESIRFRIIANSDSIEDQTIKKEIVHNLSKELSNTNNLTSIEESRKYIKRELPLFTEIVDKTLKDNNYNKDFHINYGKNYFPEKTYKNVVYPEGFYESLVITLGDGKGQNFWCVLFPPLCLVDEDNVEYKSIIKEVIDKYF